MLTNTIVKSLTNLSGGESTGYSWQGVGGTSRPIAATRRGLRLFMFTAQHGLCPDCGEALDSTAEFCHVVSRGLDAKHSDEGKGWTPGNIFLGHRACESSRVNGVCTRGNKAQQARGPVVLPEHLTRPDLVPDEWPSVPMLKSMQA